MHHLEAGKPKEYTTNGVAVNAHRVAEISVILLIVFFKNTLFQPRHHECLQTLKLLMLMNYRWTLRSQGRCRRIFMHCGLEMKSNKLSKHRLYMFDLLLLFVTKYVHKR